MITDLIRNLRKVKWRMRWMAEKVPVNLDEILYQLNRLPLQGGKAMPQRQFRFPWGDVEYISASDLRGQFQEIFIDRHYAFATDVTSPVIIDCGGNIGLSAIWFKREYPDCKLTVYEADPEVARLLLKNMKIAGITHAAVHNMAVWIEDGFVGFDNRGGDAGCISSRGSISVPSVDLAAVLPDRVDLLKLDVEGAEYRIVERLCATAKIDSIQNIAAEYHVTRKDTGKLLESLGALQRAGMKIALTASLGPWLGAADASSAFEVVGRDQNLLEVFAWRETAVRVGRC